MKILVTGGSGLLGKNLQRFIPNATYVSSKDVNLLDYAQTLDLIGSGWDHIIHAAAKVGGIVDNTENDADFYRINSKINSNVIKAAKLTGVKKLTGILSTCIYPEQVKKYPIKESLLFNGDPPKTNLGYALAKRELASSIDDAKKRGFKWNYLIPCNLYGPGDSFDLSKSHFITALLKKISDAIKQNESKIVLLGDGLALRQFMYVEDLCKVISILIERQISESFNVCNPENLSIKEMAEITMNAIGQKFDIEFTNSLSGQHRKDASISKMLSITHYKKFQFTKLEDGIRATWEIDKTRF